MTNQPKLQQLHARLEASASDYPNRAVLRDLVACFLEDVEPKRCRAGKPFCRRMMHGQDCQCDPSEDVNASPPGATTDLEAAVAVLMASFDVLSPGDHAVAVIVGELWRQGEEIARLRAEVEQVHAHAKNGWDQAAKLRAEAKPKPAGRETDSIRLLGIETALKRLMSREPNGHGGSRPTLDSKCLCDWCKADDALLSRVRRKP